MGSILTAMKYDSNGNLTQLTDDRGGDTSYAYDSHDRKTAATYHDGGHVTFSDGRYKRGLPVALPLTALMQGFQCQHAVDVALRPCAYRCA